MHSGFLFHKYYSGVRAVKFFFRNYFNCECVSNTGFESLTSKGFRQKPANENFVTEVPLTFHCNVFWYDGMPLEF